MSNNNVSAAEALALVSCDVRLIKFGNGSAVWQDCGVWSVTLVVGGKSVWRDFDTLTDALRALGVEVQPQADDVDSLRESLAAYAHDAWSGWMRYMFGKSDKNADGTVTIPASLVERWARQMETPYAELPENEKRSDRKEADEILGVFGSETEGQYYAGVEVGWKLGEERAADDVKAENAKLRAELEALRKPQATAEDVQQMRDALALG